MILVDTSVWIDHLRSADRGLIQLLGDDRVALHPFIMGELALGHIPDRAAFLRELSGLPAAAVATPAEVWEMIEQNTLSASGIGYVDAHLIASARLSGARVWTRDKRLASVARRLGVGETLH